MAVVLGFLQIRYSRKQQHFDHRQVQLSKFFTRRKHCENRARSQTHKFKLQCRRPKEYGSLLIPIICVQTTQRCSTTNFTKCTNEVWKIDELLDTIKSEIDAREASEGVKSSGIENHKPPINPKHNNRSIPTSANALVAKGPKEFKICCTYCRRLHYSASCDKVFHCESRKKILASSNRCFNCLRKGHNESQCMSEKNCRHCKKRHHQSICDQVHTKVNVSMTYESASSETSTTTTSTTTTAINENAQQPKAVLLQTARAVALVETGKISAPVRFLLDT